MLSKGGIKFIFISASFSRLELNKWRQYFKGNLPREKEKRKKQCAGYRDINRNLNSDSYHYIGLLINFRSSDTDLPNLYSTYVPWFPLCKFYFIFLCGDRKLFKTRSFVNEDSLNQGTSKLLIFMFINQMLSAIVIIFTSTRSFVPFVLFNLIL